jgi:uncharacterized membrane protein YqjE
MRQVQEDSVASPTNPNGTDVPPVLPSIPLAPEGAHRGDQSIGQMAKEVVGHLQDLVRGEVELARAEVTSEVKKGLQGSVFFIVALVIALFSLFFFFFALAELFAYLGLSRVLSFTIVFGIMLLLAGLSAFVGYLRVRKIRKPERTISSLQKSAEVLSHRGRDGSGNGVRELDSRPAR